MKNKVFENIEFFFKKPITAVIIGIFGLSLLALPYLYFENNSPLLLTVGRLHPILLHFPIVLLVLLLVIEVLSLFPSVSISMGFRFYLFIFAVFCTLLSILSGYFLYSSGEYEGLLMDQHFNGAVFTGFFFIASFVLFCVNWSAGKYLYLILVFAANAFALYTAHQGGSITHGRNYLSTYLPAIGQPKLVKADSSQFLYEDVVQLILDAKCGSCHNTLRSEGNLSLVTYADLFKKGDSGKMPVTVAQSLESEIIRRVMLPDTADDHMPTQGKKNLEPDEIEIIKLWIDLGAKENQAIQSLENKRVIELADGLSSSFSKYKFKARLRQLTKQKLDQELKEIAEDIEMVIKLDDDGEYYTLSNRFPPAPFDGEKLEKLKPYLDVFTKMSLVSTQIDDSDLYLISHMPNLTELYLQKTAINGDGIVLLSSLPKLKTLNISYTKTSDKDLIDLLKFPSLREVFVYSTNTSNEVVKAIGAHKNSLKIYSEEGPYF
ncbi:Uncharacterized membrane protein [Spirosomataceae bacterium TFI 002]|nr:Uncharacterized membrane protein [Spirosomataceae bacterium TFI 002]